MTATVRTEAGITWRYQYGAWTARGGDWQITRTEGGYRLEVRRPAWRLEIEGRDWQRLAWMAAQCEEIAESSDEP